MISMTKHEKQRIAQIRRNVWKFKRLGVDTGTWEATFFLGIIDRLIRGRK